MEILVYLSVMRAITIDSTSAGGRYADILEILESLKPECGSAVNAAAICIRESPRFQAALAFVQSNKTKRSIPRNRG